MKKYPEYNIHSLKDIEVYEHLAHYVTKTSTADRLHWLQESNEFVRLAKKAKVVKPRK